VIAPAKRENYDFAYLAIPDYHNPKFWWLRLSLLVWLQPIVLSLWYFHYGSII